MRVAVSACLLGDNCKYNGGNNYNKKLAVFLKDKEVFPICPEVMGGLTVPREPAEIRDGVAICMSGKSVNKEYILGGKRALEICLNNRIDLVILQSRSPSCGVKMIYDGSFSKRLIPGKGVFAQMALENRLNVIDIEDM